MPDIRHRVGVTAPPSAVYGELATTEGLERWWTEDVRGHAAVGGTLEFRFGSEERLAAMEVVELRPDERVVWRCVGGPEEWLGTELTFDLREGDGETVVLFTHAGWREPVEFMHHCSTKWGTFLLSMKQGVETGRARPYPRDERISSWS